MSHKGSARKTKAPPKKNKNDKKNKTLEWQTTKPTTSNGKNNNNKTDCKTAEDSVEGSKNLSSYSHILPGLTHGLQHTFSNIPLTAN